MPLPNLRVMPVFGLLWMVSIVPLTGCEPADPPETKSLLIDQCSKAPPGQVNNDAMYVEEISDSKLCVIAYCIGVPERATKASHAAAQVLSGDLKKEWANAKNREERQKAIRRAYKAAHEEVESLRKADPNDGILAVSMVAMLWKPGDGMYLANLGDCRAYRIDENNLEPLTSDDTLAKALLHEKKMTKEEAKTHVASKTLWRFLGCNNYLEGPSVQWIPFKPGERILLTSNRMHDIVDHEQILRVVRGATDPQNVAESLCNLVLTLGSKDSASAILMEAAAK